MRREHSAILCARVANQTAACGRSSSPLGPVAQLHLRVNFVPPGEAPAWVRERWVGLMLPLAQASAEPTTRLTSGVLTGPRSYFAKLLALWTGRFDVSEGYIVDAPGALDALESACPEAAAWWKEHRPDLFRPGRRLMFQKGVGNVV